MYIANTAPIKARKRTFALVSKEQCPMFPNLKFRQFLSKVKRDVGVKDAVNEVNVSTLAHLR